MELNCLSKWTEWIDYFLRIFINSNKDFNINKDILEVPNSNYSIVDNGANSQITFTAPGSNSQTIATIVGIDASTLEDNSSNIIQIGEA